MAEDLLSLSSRLLSGELSIKDRPPVSILGNTELTEVEDGIGFIESFANVVAFRTRGSNANAADGELALVDAASPFHAQAVHTAVRQWSNAPLKNVVFTHGHVDHVGGVGEFEAEEGAGAAHVIAHENLPHRFDRYRLTGGYNGIINQRQFQLGAPLFPSDFRYPDQTYVRQFSLPFGDEHLELFHDKGETDDATWVWSPERRVLCTGDLFIWVAPNCGNPQKVQRYPVEWAQALRKMADLEPALLLPGHGLPIAGTEQIRMVLTETAEFLESLCTQTLELMNAGARLDELIHTVTPPAHLTDRPWLQPIYDDPEFVVHNLWRLYGGWYNGNPAMLKPAPEADLAQELARLVGGASVLAERATELSAAGEHRLAGHLAELAAQASPTDQGVHAVRAQVFGARARIELSLMSQGVFTWASQESKKLAESGEASES
ncbi:MAG: alkyl sulfatase dimerization domain-containing protein [Microthrixaceae bacterium]